MRSRRVLVGSFGFGLIIGVIFLSFTAGAADWPRWRGPNYNGISEETGWLAEWPEEGPKQLWKASVGMGYSSFAVSNGKVYTMGNDGKKSDPEDKVQKDTVFCFDAETGKELWRHDYANQLDPKFYPGGTLATPTVADGKVYTISKDGKIFCLNADTKEVIWKKDAIKDMGIKRTTWGFSGSAFIIDDIVIFNVGPMGLALNKNDGSEVWKSGTEPGGYATPVPYTADGQKCIVMFTFKEVIGLVAKTGKELWRSDWATKHEVNAADPIIVGDKVFITSGYNRGCSLIKVTGAAAETVWENKNMRNQLSAPILWKGYLYGVDDKQMACVDFATGELKWSEKSFGKGSLMMADGKLIGLSETGKLIVVDPLPEGYKEISSVQVLSGQCWTVPVLANGRIYVRNTTGDVVCLDVKTKKKTTAVNNTASGSRQRRRQWWADLSEVERTKLGEQWRQRIENMTEEERAERWGKRGERWRDAPQEEREKFAKEMQKLSEEMLKEIRAGSSGNTWAQFRGPNRDGKSAETGLLKKWPEGGPKMLWSAEELGRGYSSVTIANGMLYTIGMEGNEGVLFAFDLEGNRKWQKTYGPEWTGSSKGARGTPTIDDGKVYVISGKGAVYCYDAASGEKKWERDVFAEYEGKYGSWGIAESPLIVDGKVIVTPGGAKATMVALDKNTSEVIWASESLGERSSYCSPILAEKGGRKIIVSMLDHIVVGVDAADGKILWQDKFADYQKKPKAINPVTPLYYDGHIYATSGYDCGGAMLKLSDDGTSVTRKWIDETLDCHHGGVVLVNGYIYGANWKGNPKGDWACLKWDTGEVMYETKWLGTKGSIMYADGMLYCYEEKNGNVALVKATPDGFEVTSSFKVPLGKGKYWAHPVILDGRLYLRHGGALMVYDIKTQQG